MQTAPIFKNERQLLWLLAFTQFTIIMDFMVMMPLGPQIMSAFKIGPAGFAMAVSSYSICSGISGLLAATYIDRFDRRHLLLTTYALFALSNLACALAPTFPMLLAARAFAGLTGGIMSSLVMVIVGDIIPPARRGEATGIVMTSFSLAAIAGVPIGIVLGAHFGWATPFYLLVLFSVIIWAAGARLVPSLTHHLNAKPPLSKVLPDLFALLTAKPHLKAFLLTFTLMASQMMIIPFISPILVANYGVQPQEISWIYMAGGAATFFTSRLIGRLSDRYGKHYTFRILAVFSILPILFLTHMPALPFIAIVLFFPIFMIAMSGRMIPLQALLTTVPDASKRGSFMSVNSALQAIGSGCGAWIGGLLLAVNKEGHIDHYGINGWIATLCVLFALFWIGYVNASPTQQRTANS
ncbi:MAG: MFS transporter [Pseudomonadota bacterium]